MTAAEFDDADLHVETATIMFADVVESVRLIQTDETINVLRIVALLRRCGREAGQLRGFVLERRGDGLLIRFESTRDACVFALRCHQYALEASVGCSAETALRFRIGIHEDTILTDGNAVFAVAVNRAARIASLALPGETQLGERAREKLTEGIDGRFEDQGLSYVKHEKEPLRTFTVTATDPTECIPQQSSKFDDIRPRVAVLLPTITAGSAADTTLGDAYCDCLIALLSRSLSMRVIARATISALANRENAIALSAGRLQCEYVIKSSLAVNSRDCVLGVELVEVQHNVVLWCENFKIESAALIDPEGEAVASIATIAVEMIVHRQLSRLTFERLPNIESQGLMMTGINLLHRQHKADFDRARDVFEHLAERHPRNPLLYTWLAAWRVFNVTQGWFSDFEIESSVAASYADRAIDLHNDAPLAHSIRGLVATNLERQFDCAENHFQLALSVDDCDALAWLHRGVSKAFVGRGDTAIEYTSEARRLSPLDPWSYYFDTLGASSAFAACEYALAVSLALSSLRANRLHLSTLRVLAMSYAELGDQANAKLYLDRVLLAEPTLTVSKYLSRSPSAGKPMALLCAAALRKAGLREQ